MNVYIKLIIFFQLFAFSLFTKIYADKSCIGTKVGELGKNWDFPSDHLPVGIILEKDDIKLNIFTWNVLNNCYLYPWMYEKNSQGLLGSQITELDEIIENNSNLTKRDKCIVEHIINSIENSCIKKDIICLQECSKEFLIELKKNLPKNYSIVVSKHMLTRNQLAIIYRNNMVKLNENLSDPRVKIFTQKPQREIMSLVFDINNLQIRVVNVHLPCDRKYNKSARKEICEYVQELKDKSALIILTGDMNSTEIEMKRQMDINTNDYILIAPYPTVVFQVLSNCYRSIAIDQFLLFGDELKVNPMPIEEIVLNAKKNLSLLENNMVKKELPSILIEDQ